MTEKKSRSGTKWGDAEYQAAGYARINLRVPASVRDSFDEMAGPRGGAKLFTEMVERERKRRKKST